MPRITLYVPDDLKARMDEASDDLNWSAIMQRAVREAIAIHQVKRNPGNMDNFIEDSVIERLRASKQHLGEKNTAKGKERGIFWATAEAEYDELSRVAAVKPWQKVTLAVLQNLIDPQSEMDENDWFVFWDCHRHYQPGDAFAESFAKGAAEVFNKVESRI